LLEHTAVAVRSAKEALLEPSALVVVRVKEQEIPVPPEAVVILREALGALAQGHSIQLLPQDRDITTQEAADLLNLSRPHFVRLLEMQKLPFHKVGTHHRVRLEDVLAYKAARSARREAAFQALAEEGLGD
jgi:excisionase family DNA binding protein